MLAALGVSMVISFLSVVFLVIVGQYCYYNPRERKRLSAIGPSLDATFVY